MCWTARNFPNPQENFQPGVSDSVLWSITLGSFFFWKSSAGKAGANLSVSQSDSVRSHIRPFKWAQYENYKTIQEMSPAQYSYTCYGTFGPGYKKSGSTKLDCQPQQL